MKTRFQERLAAVSPRLENWWMRGEQKNPVLLITAPAPHASPEPETDDLDAWWFDADFALRRWMHRIESQTYHGAAVPYHYVHLGAGSMAPLLGAPVEPVDRHQCRVRPSMRRIEEVIDLCFDPTHRCYRAVRDQIERSSALARDHHFVAPFTLGGLADTAAALYGEENLAIDMMDSPAAVHRALGRLRQLWMELFDDFQRLIARGGNPGGISRLGVWAPGSTLCLRERFARLISVEAFRRYCLPHIEDVLAVTDWPSFLLQGTGMLRHLDTLLELTDLFAFQWDPPPQRSRLCLWYDLIRHILSEGRAVQLTAQAEEVDDLVQHVGARGVLIVVRDATPDEAEELLSRYGD